MTEIAALGLKVEGVTDIDRASSSLDRLTSSSEKAEKSTGGLASASKKSSKDVSMLADSSKQASSGVDSLATVARRAAGLMVAAFAGVSLTSLIKDVALANSRFEQLGTVMEVVGRNVGLSSDQINKYAKEVQSMGISMTESRQTVIRMAQAQMDLSKASELARLAQDAAVIANTNSSDALGRLIYGLQSGQVETLRTMGLNVNFANSYTALAKEMGVAVTELTEVDKAQARTNAVMEAAAQIAGAYEASMDSASKQLGSTTRYVQDLGVMLGGVFSEATKQAVFGYSDTLKGLHETVRSLDESGVLSRISKAVATFVGGLVTASKIVAAYVASIYAIPAAKALASAATSAYHGVLALFTGQVTVTTAALFRMQTALTGLFAAFAGWQIGTYLRKEFEIVEKAGIALMGGFHSAAITIGGEFRVLGEHVKFALTNPLSFARGKIIDFLQWLQGLGASALNFLGLDGLAASIDKDLDKLRTTTDKEHRKLLAGIRKNTQSEMKAVGDIYADMFAQVGKDGEKSLGIIDKQLDALMANSKIFGFEAEGAAESVKELSDEAQKLLDKLYPLKARARELSAELNILRQLAKDGLIDPSVLDDWYEKNLMIATSIREEMVPAAEEMAAQANPLAESWQAALERIDSAFVDLWKSAFNGFKDFADSLKNAFFQLLAELAHRATTQKILVSLGLTGASGGAMAGVAGGGSAMASAASGASGIGGGGSLVGGAKSLLSGGLSALGEGYVVVGNRLLDASSPVLQNLGLKSIDVGAGYQGSLGGGLANLGMNLGAGFAGNWLGSQIFGDSKYGGTGGAIGGLVGSLFGPAGTGIGSFLGNAVGSLFGGKKRADKTELGLDFATGSISETARRGHAMDDSANEIANSLMAAAAAIGGSEAQFTAVAHGKAGLGIKYEGGGSKYFQDYETFFDEAFKLILEGAGQLTPELKRIMSAFEGTAEQTVNFSNAIYTIGESLKQNPVEAAMRDFSTAQEQSATTLYGAYRQQLHGLQQLIQGYDGTDIAAQRLSAALSQSQQAAYQLTMQAQSLKLGMNAMFEGSARSFREAAMSEEELRLARELERGRLRGSISRTQDISELEETLRRIDTLNTQLFQSISDPTKAQAESFAAYAESVQAEGAAQIDSITKSIEQQQQQQMDRIEQVMTSAANQQQTAADTMLTAAQMIQNAFRGQFNQAGNVVI